MAAEEIASGLSNWIIVIISTLAGVVVGFVLNLWRDKLQEKKARRQEALETHFNQDTCAFLSHISNMGGLKKMIGGKLAFGAGAILNPISDKFPINNEQSIKAFEVHFPIIAKRWDILYDRAIDLEHEREKSTLSDSELSDVSKELSQLADEAKNALEDIRRYQVGTVFKYNKKCPICKKF